MIQNNQRLNHKIPYELYIMHNKNEYMKTKYAKWQKTIE